jgi:hypothetical protein
MDTTDPESEEQQRQTAMEEDHKKRVQDAQALLQVIESMSAKQNIWRDSFEAICHTEAVEEARSHELTRSVLLQEAESLASGDFVHWMLSREARGVQSSESLNSNWFHNDAVALLTPFQAMVPYPSRLTAEGLRMVQDTIDDLFFEGDEAEVEGKGDANDSNNETRPNHDEEHQGEGTTRKKKKDAVFVRSLSGAMPQWFLGESMLLFPPQLQQQEQQVAVCSGVSKSAPRTETASSSVHAGDEEPRYATHPCRSGAEVVELCTKVGSPSANSKPTPDSDEQQQQQEGHCLITSLSAVLARTPCLFLDGGESPNRCLYLAKAAVVQGKVIAAQLSAAPALPSSPSSPPDSTVESSVVEWLAHFVERTLCPRLGHRTFLATVGYYAPSLASFAQTAAGIHHDHGNGNGTVKEGRWALIALDPLSGEELELFSQRELLTIAAYLAKYRDQQQQQQQRDGVSTTEQPRVLVTRWYDVERRGPRGGHHNDAADPHRPEEDGPRSLVQELAVHWNEATPRPAIPPPATAPPPTPAPTPAAEDASSTAATVVPATKEPSSLLPTAGPFHSRRHHINNIIIKGTLRRCWWRLRQPSAGLAAAAAVAVIGKRR